MNWLDVRIAFPSGLVRSYLDFPLYIDYLLRILFPFKVIAKASRASGILRSRVRMKCDQRKMTQSGCTKMAISQLLLRVAS